MKTNIRKTMPALLAAAGVVMAWSTADAQVSVGDYIFYFHGDGPGESLAVTDEGRQVVVATPIEQDVVKPKDEVFESFMSTVMHKAGNKNHPFTQSIDMPLGGGEVTDVAPFWPRPGDPRGPFTVVNVRDDDAFDDNVLYVVQGKNVAQAILLPDSADGIKLSPDANLLVVAVEKERAIRIYDTSGGAGHIALAAVIDQDALLNLFGALPTKLDADDLEPESIAISKDGTFALVTLQDASAVASVDLTEVSASIGSGRDPTAVGDAALVSIVRLPFGFEDSKGKLRGLEPDGICISPDQTFAIAMGEANNKARHLQSIAVLDLTGGLLAITHETHCIFDVDKSLLDNTGLDECPAWTDTYPSAADKLPRLDPASCEIVERGGITLGALVIERYVASDLQEATAPGANETNGSLMLLDLTDVLDGDIGVLGRVPVGPTEGSRLEAIDSAEAGRWIFISISNGGGDDGTFARLEILED